MGKVIKFESKMPERRCYYCHKIKDDYKYMEGMNEFYSKEKNIILDYSPCRECAEKWKKTYIVIEMSNEQQFEGMPVFAEGVNAYPTGRIIGLKENLFDQEANIGEPRLI